MYAPQKRNRVENVHEADMFAMSWFTKTADDHWIVFIIVPRSQQEKYLLIGPIQYTSLCLS